MLLKVYSILAVYFLLGALGIFFINRKEREKAAKRERWVKYVVYLLLVNAVILIIHSGYFLYLAILLVLLGLYEIGRVGSRNYRSLAIALLIYSFFSVFFVLSYWQMYEFPLISYLLVLTFDGFSQISGQLFGKNKLAPFTSPNKTVEGFLGGMISVIITMLILIDGYHNFETVLLLMVYGILFSGIALSGDLIASYYKRINKVKDYSKLIPGHGGVLDRFDSFIFTLGFLSFVLTLFSWMYGTSEF